MSKAIIFCPKASTFVKRDKAMLNQKYGTVDLVEFRATSALSTIGYLLKDVCILSFKIRKYDLVVSWFVGYHSIVPFLYAYLFGVKTVSILGGTEGHNYPEYNYGNYRKLGYGWATRLSLRLSNYIFPVHESLIESHETYVPLQYPKQGILSFNQNLKGHIEEIYCGFEMQRKWQQNEKIKDSFLSVSTHLYGMDYLRKGIDSFVMLAENFPECQFTLVGNGYEGKDLPNLKVISEISYEGLISIYCSHVYYVQLSIAEGFPNALAEAMLYGCIPIGSSVFGIPSMIGDTGFVVAEKNDSLVLHTVRKILSLPREAKQNLAKEASEKVAREYTFAKRSEKFYRIIGK